MPVILSRRRRKGALGGSAKLVRRAVEAALAYEGAEEGEVSVLLTDNREIQELNQKYRGVDRPTDVLAFAFDDDPNPTDEPHDRLLGDLAISVEKASDQAVSRRVTLDQELELLAVHGALHLLGYDHAEAEDARIMRARTRTIRRRLRR